MRNYVQSQLIWLHGPTSVITDPMDPLLQSTANDLLAVSLEHGVERVLLSKLGQPDIGIQIPAHAHLTLSSVALNKH